MSIWWSIILIIFAAYVIIGLSLYFMQSTFLYHPAEEIVYNPGNINLGYEDITIETSDSVKINGWFVPAENSKLTVLFCHGNAGNMAHRLDTINFFNELGLNCLVFDYRGYGLSEGKPSEQGTYLDAQAAWQWLTEKKNINSENIIIFGRSLGGSIAAQLATSTNPKGLVLESCFTSYVDVGKKFYPYMPVNLFASFSYDTREYITKIKCPLMIIHSRADEIIPFEFGLKLYDIAKEPKEFLEIFGTHNDGFMHSDQIYKQGWVQWLETLGKNKQITKPDLQQIL